MRPSEAPPPEPMTMHVVATAGHVDHGKSTLLRALTGMEPDRWEQEQRRGLTLDLGHVWTEFDTEAGGTRSVAFVDVPGHERFLANMLAGVGATPMVLFVVAADEGWAAQSQEHLEILDLLGVRASVVAITKADLVSARRLDEVTQQVGQRLGGSVLAGAPLLATDALTQRGLAELRRVLAAQLPPTGAETDDGTVPRLWIDRAFAVRGAGTVVTGTLQGGALREGQQVVVLPGGHVTRIRELQCLGQRRGAAAPTSRVAVNLGQVSHDALERGQRLVARVRERAPSAGLVVSTVADARVRALPGRDIAGRGAWQLHVGTARRAVTLHPLLADAIPAGDEGFATLAFQQPLPLRSGDRFVLRETGQGRTMGGGEVLDPSPPSRAKGTHARLARLDQLEALHRTTSIGRVSELVRTAGGVRSVDELAAATGRCDVEAQLDTARVSTVGRLAVSREILDHWRTSIRCVLTPDECGGTPARAARRDTLTSALQAAGCPGEAVDGVLAAFVDRGELCRVPTGFVLPEHADEVEAARRRRAEQLIAALEERPFAPPALSELAETLAVPHEEVTQLIQGGQIVVCGEVAFAASAIDRAIQLIAELSREVGPFTVPQVRDLLGSTRKYVMPLLTHLDARGLTRFDGHEFRELTDRAQRRLVEPPLSPDH